MAQEKLFITGATGFIGSHVVQGALERGHHVRVSVRRDSQAETLKQLFAAHSEKLEVVVVPDITQPDAFKHCLDAVDSILHIASPMPGKGEDFQTEYLDPAVRGTEAIFNAAQAAGSVKRVVITSSILACIPLGQMDAPDLVVKEDQTQDMQVSPSMTFPSGPAGYGAKYQASKILAHQATRDWIEQHKPAFSVVTLHPSFVLGPSLTRKSATDIDGINAWFWSSMAADAAPFPCMVVDVRDVAEAHLQAAIVPTQRKMTEILLNGYAGTWEPVLSVFKKEFPDLGLAWKSSSSKPSDIDVSRAESVLGMQWRPVEEMFRGLVTQQLHLQDQKAAV